MVRCRSLFLSLSLCETYERSRVCICPCVYVARLRLYTRWFTCSASAHAQGDKSTLSGLRPFYWSTILPCRLPVSFFLSHPYPSVLTRPVSLLLLSLSRSLFHSPLSFSQYYSSVYAKTHTSPDSMHWFPILVIRIRQNRTTPCRCNGVIQERAFTPARA